MSAIVFLSPGIYRGVSVDALHECMRKPKMRSKRPAIFDCDVRSLWAHETADVLSQKVAMCSFSRLIPQPSSASQPSNFPQSLT